MWCRRIWLPLQPGVDEVVTEDLVDDPESFGRWGELPAINPTKRQSKHRYVYAATIVRPAGINNSVRVPLAL